MRQDGGDVTNTGELLDRVAAVSTMVSLLQAMLDEAKRVFILINER